ncbi:MAG: pseudouridine-5'-phosphate glycosidase, partial [Planctomycetota bacterium]
MFQREPRCWRYGSDEVRDALRDGHPVVALETAVLTHGLPEPEHRQAMMRMQNAVRDAGAVAAVIGVIDGELIVGLTEDEIGRLARRATAASTGLDSSSASSSGATPASSENPL